MAFALRRCIALYPKFDRAPRRLLLGLSIKSFSCSSHNEANLAKPESSKKKSRVRQHVNPLTAMYQHPVPLEADWISKHFKNPALDFVIDIGCARGTWCLKTASSPEGASRNYLGLDLRRPVVEEALARKQRAQPAPCNVHFLASNANVDLPRLLTDVAQLSKVSMLCIHHPDPLFKLRHKKRQVVTPELVKEIAERVLSGCAIYLQSDIIEAIQNMTEEFGSHAAFAAPEGFDPGRLFDNPAPHFYETEREVAVLAQGGPVFRMMFVKQ